MKKISHLQPKVNVLLVTLFLFLSSGVFGQTTYYSQGNLAPNLTSSWSSNPSGGGTSPSDFSSGDNFIIQSGHTMTTTTSWDLSTFCLSLTIQTGGKLIANNAITLDVSNCFFDIQSGASYVHNNNSKLDQSIFSAFDVNIEEGSLIEIKFNNFTIQTSFAFSNLTINAATVKANTSGLGISVDNLTINSGCVLNILTRTLSSNNHPTITTSGTGQLQTQLVGSNPLPINISWTFDVLYNSSSLQTIVTGNYTNLNASGGNRSISANTIKIAGTFTPGSGTYTVTGSTIEYNGSGSQSLPSAFTSYNNLIISNTGTKTLTGNVTVAGLFTLSSASDYLAINGNTLTLNGTTTFTGGLKGSNSSHLIIGGSSGGSVALKFNVAGTDNYLNTLTLNRTGTGVGITLSSNISITNLLSVTSGSFDLSNSDVTLKSTSISNTALMDKVTGSLNYSGTGRFITERYINNVARGYRNIASSVLTTDIWSNWQESATTTSSNPNPGYGTQITGEVHSTAGVDPVTGIDYSGSGSASLWTYNTADGFDVVTNTKTKALYPYVGYFMIVRGDRSYSLYPATNTTTAPTTLRARGKSLAGTVTINPTNTTYYFDGGTSVQTDNNFKLNSAAGGPSSNFGFSLIGNPFPCMLDWSSVYGNSSNIMNTYWVWDQSTAGGSGSYITVNNSGINTGGGSNAGYIQPGQSFYIQNTSTGSPTLIMRESDKNTGSGNLVSVFGGSNSNLLRCNLSKKISGNSVLMDGAVVLFSSNYNNTVDDNDAGKFVNPLENIAIYRSNDTISIEQRNIPTVSDTISLRLWNVSTSNDYSLNIIKSQFSSTLNAYLLDKLLGTKTLLTGDTTTLSFTVTNDTGSYLNRFKIVFGTSTPLSVSLISVKAYQHQRSNVIEWSSADEASDNVLRYEIERSANGQSFTTVGFNTSYNSNGISNYKWIDSVPFIGDNYYRIKIVNRGGSTIKYSAIVVVRILAINAQASVYPNPIAKNAPFTVQLNNAEAGNYTIQLFNISGQQVFIKTLQHPGGSASQQMQVDKILPTGIYRLKISSAAKANFFEETLLIQ